uniref:Glycine receptor subunit alpha 1/3-like 097 n=1 Tax=Saccoglossus kowalevskii TaxID=10224 RepID=A0A0U2U2P0_SACKO|nr:glycine receptor subunit alpha 1/3-like 097 [Saccoglossus kowalevskii]
MVYNVYLLLVILLYCDAVLTENATTRRGISDLLTGYDKILRPNMEGPPVIVTTSIHINNFYSSTDKGMDYTTTIFLRTRWNDPRLQYNGAPNHTITLHSDGVKEVWVPPLFFPDEKSGHFHKLTTENILLRIYPDGTVLHSARFTIKLGCMMKLERYPMDEQTCNMEIESFTYTTDDLILQWAPEDDDLEALGVQEGISLPQFTFKDMEPDRSRTTRHYATGNFSYLIAKLRLRRQQEIFIMSAYVPSTLIVIVSWFSFWINPNCEPARVSLVMMALLTLCTQMNGIQAKAPNIAHMKASDVWMSSCLVFVFAALVEYAAVNFISLKIKMQNQNEQSLEMVNRAVSKNPSTESDFETSVSKSNQYDVICHVRPQRIDYYSRIVFPITFMVFNVFYWLIYLC